MSVLPEGLPPYISDDHEGPETVDAALHALGLSREYLRQAARAGVARRRLATPFEPSTAPGLNDWIARTGQFRQLMYTEGWAPLNPANAPFSKAPDGAVLVGVMRGNEATGCPSGDLISYYPKGAMTAKLTLRNETTFRPIPGIDEFLGLNVELDAAKVWFFVTRHEEDKKAKVDRVHAEVSQPEPTEANQRVKKWARRVCLTPFEFPIPDADGDFESEFSVTLR